jgi:hypothetical protein
MSLNRYHNSRSSDNVFKLLHEETSYLDILKSNVKAVHRDEIGEETGSIQSDIRQLLQEQDPGMEEVEAADVKEKPEDEGTPEQQAAAAEEAGAETAIADKEKGIKEESLKQFVEQELEEISLAVAGQGASRKFTPGLRG